MQDSVRLGNSLFPIRISLYRKYLVNAYVGLHQLS